MKLDFIQNQHILRDWIKNPNYFKCLCTARKNFEIRELTLENTSEETKSYEVTTYSEIMLDDFKAGIAHPLFNKLFVETSYEDGVLIAKRKKRYIRDIEKFAFHFGFS